MPADPPETDAEEPRERRLPGPPPPIEVRRAGDPALAEMLAAAVSQHGVVHRATHGFHTYPAGMHPDAARLVIESCPGPVHDPFCGAGTVLVEAILAGRRASGTDLSPVAVLASRARTAARAMAPQIRSWSRRLTATARAPGGSAPAVPELCRDWYEPHVAREIARIRSGIDEAPSDVRPVLLAVLSSILIKASFRESDTSNRRAPTHRPPGTTAVLFHKKARELARGIDDLPPSFDARIATADARRRGPPDGTGLIVTSPPYPGVYDYLPMQQLRYAWLGIDAGRAPADEVGSRRSFRAEGRADAFRHWREDTARWIAKQAAGLSSGGRLAVVVGDGLVAGRTVDALSPTAEALAAAGLRVLARASADRHDHARGTIRTEHLVLAERA